MNNDPHSFSLTPGLRFENSATGFQYPAVTGARPGASVVTTEPSGFFGKFDRGLDLGFKSAALVDRIRFGPQPQPVEQPLFQPQQQSGFQIGTSTILLGVAAIAGVLYLRKKS